MTIKKVLTFFLLAALSVPPPSSWAYWVWSPEAGKFINTEGPSQDAADEVYHSAMQFYREKNLDQATEQLEGLLKKFPNSKIAGEAQYRLGTIYEERQEYIKAFRAYKALLQSYPQSDRLSEVIEREFRIGNLFLSGQKGKLMGLEILPALPRAIEVFKHIGEQAPYSEYGDKAQFQLGIAYKKAGRYGESVEAFQALIDQYPKSELVADARFQLAETSYLRSASEFRDQRALDEASTQVDSFLNRYPDTTTSEEAAKLRQAIDEKNAEKNYRIGLYYEKDNYLDSALIYYADIAKRYPNTSWGQKAIEKLKSLKDPAGYLTSEEKEIDQQIVILEAKIKGLGDQDKFERERMERQLERLKTRKKAVDKNKGESLKRRASDLKRRERELKIKFKNLEKKQKLLKKNPSEDLKKALDRWLASLENEKVSLENEKRQLAEWRETLGVRAPYALSLDFLPFVGEAPSELQQVRGIEAKKYFKISDEKKALLDEKEVLYKQRSEIQTMLQDLENQQLGISSDEIDFEAVVKTGDEHLIARQKQIQQTKKELEELEKIFSEKRAHYEDKFGEPGWLKMFKLPASMVTVPASAVVHSVNRSVAALNPFGGKNQSLEASTLEQLLERQMHLKEKIAAQQGMVETLQQAFDTELALQEQKRMMASLEEQGNEDMGQLRKVIRSLERDVRGHYEEISDRHERKKQLLAELDDVLSGRAGGRSAAAGAAATLTSPVTGAAKLTKAFFFGLPNKDVELTRQAAAVKGDSETASRATALKEEIEKESIVIEAKNNELRHLQKELEIMRAKAALSQGAQFRSAMVTVPYDFIKEAVESAHRVVPQKNREEFLINLLDKETGELEAYKTQLKQINALIQDKTASRKTADIAAPSDKKAKRSLAEYTGIGKNEAEEQAPDSASVKAQSEKEEEEKKGSATEARALQKEIEEILGQISIKQGIYEKERALLVTEWRAVSKELKQDDLQDDWKEEAEDIAEHQKKLSDELREIEKDLRETIHKESELETEESKILSKRIERIDSVVTKLQSKALAQDLLTERQRMEERVSQLDLRQDFLTKEIERFQLAEANTKKP